MYTFADPTGPYWVGDRPPAYVTEIQDDGAAVDLQAGDVVTAGLSGPAGVVIPEAAATVDPDQDTVTVSLDAGGDASPFAAAGVYRLTGTVAGLRIQPLRIAVQADDGWHDLESARTEWRDLPQDPVVALELLATARADVEAFAPALAAGSRPPANYRQAQVMHARDIWTANRADPASGDLGSGFALTPFPLDWMVKQILRPKRAGAGLVY